MSTKAYRCNSFILNCEKIEVDDRERRLSARRVTSSSSIEQSTKSGDKLARGELQSKIEGKKERHELDTNLMYKCIQDM